jgi:acyl-CoA synthetase (NDP forming)
MGDFDGLLHPRGIAVVGASSDLARPGGRLVQVLREWGYAGRVHPVNPKYQEVAGLRCVPSPRDIDGPCDLAMIALRADHAAAAVRECGAAGIRFAVIYGGGFREAGDDGRARETALREAARAGGVRLIGPNCLGVLNLPDRVCCGMGPMLREPRLAAGPVSLVSQSGGFGYSLALRCSDAGHGLRYVVTSGNEADITTPELIDYFLDDPQTRIVVSYIEGLADGRALMAAGRKAAALGKPLLVWKAGRHEQGARAVASHTASMTGRYDLYRAAFRQCGILEVNSIAEVVDLVRAFSAGKPPRGTRVGLTGGSGGAAIVFADACDEHGIEIPALDAATVRELQSQVAGTSARGNPVDYTGGWLDDPNVGKFRNVVRLLLADRNVDQLCIMFSTAQGKPALNGAEVLAAAAARSDKPILVFSSAPPASVEAVLGILAGAGIPVLDSPQGLARAVAATAAFAAARARATAAEPPPPRLPVAGGRKILNEYDSKQWLAQHGIPVTHDRVLAIGAPVPADLDYPAVAKVLARDLPHKSDAGGVALNLRDAAALTAAIAAMLARVRTAAPAAHLEGVLVTAMVDDALEVIVGVVNDAAFGPVVALGLGGTLAEVLHDVTYRVAPFDAATAQAMITDLRGRALFDGVRGQAPRDTAALAQTVARVSVLAWELRSSLLELDINPLFVRAAGAGVVAGDALAVLANVP